MKNVSFILSTVGMILISCGAPVSEEEVTSKEVTIGSQVWMTKNLDVATFRNGDPIPEAKTDQEWKKAGENKQPVWCYAYPEAEVQYGKLYNWYAVNDPRGLAPKGYHIPTDEEWTILINHLGGPRVAGKKMKSATGWRDIGIPGDRIQNNGNGTNESGFSAFPAGSRTYVCSLGGIANFWSSSEFDTNFSWTRCLYGDDDDVHREDYGELKSVGNSVRCIKN